MSNQRGQYATASWMLGPPSPANVNLLSPHPSHSTFPSKPITSFTPTRNYPYAVTEKPKPVEHFKPSPQVPPILVEGGTDPKIWGPKQWYSLHNGAAQYPLNPTSIVRDRMKGFILGLPYTLPCQTCFQHAITYIESKAGELDLIVSSRQNLFKFWVDFHNTVNKRLGKPIISLEDAWKKFSGTGVKK